MHAPIAAVPLRRPEETARELAELRDAAAKAIAPEDVDRYRERARRLRAEAMQHLIDTAIAAARSKTRSLFERDAAEPVGADPSTRCG
ncbi:MAG: hypothetical protein FJX57_00010 [Alphaproteobacteria bacterium]|nr:hypothetical protein [Alphaproteobacteria bacterium]